MEKYQAVLFILDEFRKDRNHDEIASDLNRKLDVPYEIVLNFVRRTIEQYASIASSEKAIEEKCGEILDVDGSSKVDLEGRPFEVRKLPIDETVATPIIAGVRTITAAERYRIWLQTTFRRANENWKVFSKNRLAVLGLCLLFYYLLMALIHPLLLGRVWPKRIYDPVVGHDMTIFPHPAPPSGEHLLGTDTLGRDVLSVLMAATQPSFVMAIIAALTAAILGTFIGAFTAYFRGALDVFFSSLADISLMAPAPLVMVIIGFLLDVKPAVFGVIYGVLSSIGVVAIVLRAHALTIRSKSFIQAAEVAGGGPIHIIFSHLIPHLLPLAAVNMLLIVTGAIFASGFIAFLGLSRAQLNWGSMIYDAFTYEGINGVLPWNVLIPAALAISLFAASFYLIALGLQDVVEPRMAEKRRQEAVFGLG